LGIGLVELVFSLPRGKGLEVPGSPRFIYNRKEDQKFLINSFGFGFHLYRAKKSNRLLPDPDPWTATLATGLGNPAESIDMEK